MIGAVVKTRSTRSESSSLGGAIVRPWARTFAKSVTKSWQDGKPNVFHFAG